MSASLLTEIEPTRCERPATRAGDVVTAASARLACGKAASATARWRSDWKGNEREVQNDELVALRRGDSENREQGDRSTYYFVISYVLESVELDESVPS